mgnify:CR=1 FL=1|tara:strand:- start:111 stop:380 length:270 start_codon:yes stop_codon:yes gene_type:complete
MTEELYKSLMEKEVTITLSGLEAHLLRMAAIREANRLYIKQSEEPLLWTKSLEFRLEHLEEAKSKVLHELQGLGAAKYARAAQAEAIES